MSTYKIFKETAMPGVVENNSIYLVAPAGTPDYVEMYVTGTSGAIKRIHTESDIQAMIDASLASISEVQVAADITARDALTLDKNLVVLVLDASDDATVESGAATYVYNLSNTTWTKIAEYESMDVSVSWADITGKPTSSAASIDTAVANSHTHSNKSEIDKVGEDGAGVFQYNGAYPHIGWDSENW